MSASSQASLRAHLAEFRPGEVGLLLAYESEAARFLGEVGLTLLSLHEIAPPHRPAFKRISVAIHPELTGFDPVETVVAQGERELKDRELAAMRSAAKSRLVISTMESGSLDELVSWWCEVPSTDATVVVGADRFFSVSQPPPPSHQATTRSPFNETIRFYASEETWGPRLIELARRLRKRDERPCTICLSAAGTIAYDHMREKVFAEFDAVMSSGAGADSRALVQLPDWSRRLVAGENPAVISAEVREVVRRDDIAEQILAQALSAAGLFHEAWAAVRSQVQKTNRAPPDWWLTMAGIALNAGDTEEARRMLSLLHKKLPCVPSTLLLAFDLAAKLNAEEIGRDIQGALLRVAPYHPRVRRILLYQALHDHRFRDARTILEQDEEIELSPVSRLHVAARVDWEMGSGTAALFIAAARRAGEQDDAIALVAQRDLEQTGVEAAVATLMSAELGPRVGISWSEVFLRASREETPEGTLELAYSRMCTALAQNPVDRILRGTISDRFETGNTGQVATFLTLRLAGLNPPFQQLSWPELPPHCSPEEVFAFFKSSFADRAGAVVRAQVPEQLTASKMPAKPNEMYWGILNLVQNWATSIPWEDPMPMAMLVKAGLDLTESMDLSPVEKAYRELDLFALSAKGAALQGEFQQARDLAEAVLEFSKLKQIPAIQRLAWITYADIYLHCNNRPQALLGLACAFSTDAKPSRGRDRVTELQVRIRCLRELDPDDRALELARRYADLTCDEPSLKTRSRFLFLSVQVHRLDRSDLPALAQLTSEAATFLAEVLAEDAAEVLPAVMLYVQVARQCKNRDLAVPVNGEELVASALASLPPEAADRVRALYDDSPDVDSLFARLLKLYRSTAYVEDLASDRFEIAMVARAILRGAGRTNALLALRALEILTDVSFRESHHMDPVKKTIAHGYRRLLQEGSITGSRATVEATSGPVGPTQSRALAANEEVMTEELDSLSRNDIEFHALAFDDIDEFVHLRKAPRSELSVIKETSLRFKHFHEWASEYPHGYSAYPRLATKEQVQRTLKGVQFSTQPDDPTVTAAFVTSVGLASLPLNLLLREGEFAGALGPVIGVPSVAWLRDRPTNPPSLGARKLWIMPGPEAGTVPSEALSLLADVLPRAMAEHSIEVIPNAAVDAIDTAELGVVAAHGVLGLGSRHFEGIADGFSARYESVDVVARLEGTKVVVLLVCSGGHQEKAHHGMTTTGLARMLLDAGVRCVVAPAWSLDVHVASSWLGPFLAACDRGIPVARATYEANLCIRAEFKSPLDWLAMHTYGDPRLALKPTKELRQPPSSG